MDFEERCDAINQILSGQYIVDYYGDLYIFKDPDINLLGQGALHRKRFRKEAIIDGFLTKEQEKALLDKNGLWKPDDEAQMDRIKDTIANLRKELKRYEFQSLKLAEVKKLIEINEAKLLKLYSIKNTFRSQTIEFQTDYLYYCWILSQCLYNSRGHLHWESYNALEDDVDDHFIKFMVNVVFNRGLFNEKELREIARSEPWRTLRKGQSAPSHISPTRMYYMLSYWSHVYDIVYESSDGLTSDQIADDDLINQWLADKQVESTNRTKKSGFTDNPKISGAQEVFIAVNTPEDAQKVYNTMNDADSRNRIRMRQKMIQEKGRVKETEMKDTQNFLQMEMNKAMTATIKASR